MYDRLGELLSDALESGSLQRDDASAPSVYDVLEKDAQQGKSALSALAHNATIAATTDNATIVSENQCANTKMTANTESEAIAAAKHADIKSSLNAERARNGSARDDEKRSADMYDSKLHGAAAQFYRTFSQKKRRGEIVRGVNSVKKLVAVPKRIAAAYAVLGISSSASEKELRSAYREKLKLFHPDSNSENETVQRVAHKKTEEVVAAYTAITAWRHGHSK